MILPNDFKIKQGITINQKQQLINLTNHDALIKSTTNDLERFKDEKTLRVWLTKNRKVYALINKNNNLCGIIWFGKKIMPIKNKFLFTFAIRLYGKARGKGFAFDFIHQTIDKFKQTDEYINANDKSFWLITNNTNIAAIKTYTKLGFKQIEYLNKENKILMILN